jgi:hypothetical protein
VLSADVLRHAGQAASDAAAHEIDVRGRQGRLKVYALSSIPGA